MSGHQAFLTLHAGLAAMLVLAAVLVWRLSQPTAHTTPERLSDIELAALNGGSHLAVIAAATELRRSHVTQTPEGTLLATGPLVDDAGELERELFEKILRTPGDPGRALVENAVDSPTVVRIVMALESAGLRLGDDVPRRLAAVRRCAIALGIAGGAGLLAIAVTGDAGATVLGASAALTVAMLVLARWAKRRRGGATIAGRRLLKAVRCDRAAELRAAGGHPTLAVAILGTSALWLIDPPYAAALGIPAAVETSVGANALAFGAGWEAGCGECGGCGGCGG